jgi:hypothetical protein
VADAEGVVTVTATTLPERPSRNVVRAIRPPDPLVRGTPLEYMRASTSHEPTRVLVHFAFRDCSSVLDLTYAHGGFWRDPLPPGLRVATNNLDPSSAAELHLDFTRTGLPDAAYDVAVYDPPHVADGGAGSIIARRFGTVRGTDALRGLIVAGAREAWRIASVGVLVKVTDHSHGGEFLSQSDWVKAALPVLPYVVLHAYRGGYLRDGKHRVQRVPRSNGAVYLAFRKDGYRHKDFDRLYARQPAALRLGALMVLGRCATCNGPLGDGRRDRISCSGACRQKAYRRRRAGGARP